MKRIAIALLLLLLANVPLYASDDLNQLLVDVSAAYARLEPQSIRPAERFIPYDYLIPAGYYKQMWDWDGFFIGCHLSGQSVEKAKYLKWWVLDFASAVDQDGYIPGCITTKGPRPVFGKFAMKPFLAQGAVIASERTGDYAWVSPIWEKVQKVVAYRERTQYDPKYGLFFWDNAGQSGADNNVALTNDPKDPSAILAVDLCAFQYREYRAMAILAAKLGKPDQQTEYQRKADRLKSAMLKYMWSPKDQVFFNVRRDSGKPVRRISYSSFVPLMEDILPKADAQKTIRTYLLNPNEMLSKFGIRSLTKTDPEYNNVSMIVPYSNWQGPVWINANYMHYIALRKHGFNKEAHHLAGTLGRMVLADIEKWHSMHENYNAETGDGLAPTPEQSPNGIFTGFVGWNLLVQDMLQCEVHNQCSLLTLR